ncbi:MULTISPECIES: hypothetical protein [unclassified Rickettsia]
MTEFLPSGLHHSIQKKILVKDRMPWEGPRHDTVLVITIIQ